MGRTFTERVGTTAVFATTVALCVMGLPEVAFPQTRGLLGYDADTDAGYVRLFGTNGNSHSRPWVSSGGDNDRGILQLYNDGSDRVVLMIDSNGQGLLSLEGSTGNRAARLTVDNSDDAGILWLYHNSGEVRAALEVDGFGQGKLGLDGSDNTERARLSVYDDIDAGFLELRDGSGTTTITLNGDTGDISKSGSNGFLVPYPKDPGKEIFYTALEGPERGMYVRGSATLENGRVTVKLPAHFALLARAEDMSVQVTPGSAETYGLAVVRKKPSEIEVRELAGGKGSFSFDYLVFASRQDMPPLQVVRDRQVSGSGQSVRSGGKDGAAGEEKRDMDDDVPDREPVDSSSERR